MSQSAAENRRWKQRRLQWKREERDAVMLERTEQLSRDPLNDDLVPDDAAGLNIGVVAPTTHFSSTPTWRPLVRTAALLVVARTATWAFGTPALELGAFAIALTFAAIVAIRTHGDEQLPRRLLTVLQPLAIYAFAFAPSTQVLWLTLGLALVALKLLADGIIEHEVTLETARVEPSLSNSERQELRSFWCSEEFRSQHPTHDEAKHRREYDGAFVFLAALAVLSLALSAVAPTFGLPDVLATALGVALLAIGVLLRAAMSWKECSAAFAAGVTSWLGYNTSETIAPGVVRSPGGASFERRAEWTRASKLFFASVLLLTGFVPLVFFVERPTSEPWADAASYFPREFVERISSTELPADLKARAREELGVNAVRYLHLQAELENERRVNVVRAEAADALSRRPEAWLSHLWRFFITSDHKLEVAVIVLFSLVLSLLLPAFLFHAALFVLTGATLTHFRSWRATAREEGDRTTAWQSYVNRVATSNNKPEKEHVLLGWNKLDNYPVLVHRKKLGEHVHILGGSGAGKTAMLSSLVSQLIRDGDSVVILDLKGDKGDMSLFEQARISAEECGHTFKWFTSEEGRSTFTFNPLLQRHIADLSPSDMAELFVKPMGLSYGDDYGKGFFSRTNREALEKTFESFHEKGARPTRFVDLKKALAKHGRGQAIESEKDWDRASDMRHVVNALAGLDVLNVTPEDELPEAVTTNAIDMGDVYDDPTVLYFWMPASVRDMGSREMAKFAAHSLLTAGEKRGRDRCRIWFIVDEFQQIVSKDLELFVSQARSMGIGTILANQNMGQLREASENMPAIITSNTDTQLVFSAKDSSERTELSLGSGETIYHMQSWSHSLGSSSSGATESHSFSTNQSIGPRLTVNDLIQMSAEPRTCYVRVASNHGYACFDGFPFLMTFDYHIDQETYDERKAAPWPAEDPEGAGTIAPPLWVRPQASVSPQQKAREVGHERKAQPRRNPLG